MRTGKRKEEQEQLRMVLQHSMYDFNPSAKTNTHQMPATYPNPMAATYPNPMAATADVNKVPLTARLSEEAIKVPPSSEVNDAALQLVSLSSTQNLQEQGTAK